MKKKTLMMAAGLLLNAGRPGWAQEADPWALNEEKPVRAPIQARLSFRSLTLTHAHDALQHRADYTETARRHWQDGDSGGDGAGFSLSLKQGPGEVTLRYERQVHDFKQLGGGGEHVVQTWRDDLEALYSHAREGKDEFGEKAAWGWKVGIRDVASHKKTRVVERAARLQRDGDVSWKLLQGGYWGVWRPAAWNVRLFGSLIFLFGEVDGMARTGNDTEMDGRIQESYRNEQGLAYGLNFALGASVDLFRYVRLEAGYRRDWLYSFHATDSGIVVFPDNNDARFIENTIGVYAGIGFQYAF